MVKTSLPITSSVLGFQAAAWAPVPSTSTLIKARSTPSGEFAHDPAGVRGLADELDLQVAVGQAAFLGCRFLGLRTSYL